ncbi:hypothetical protein [Thermoplasma acidophilum]|nr:hypothetical protein [Thermoplasma acidophilum]MCY0852305.1 hypothetical protein [Thermoplasma acidophilum]
MFQIDRINKSEYAPGYPRENYKASQASAGHGILIEDTGHTAAK